MRQAGEITLTKKEWHDRKYLYKRLLSCLSLLYFSPFFMATVDELRKQKENTNKLIRDQKESLKRQIANYDLQLKTIQEQKTAATQQLNQLDSVKTS